jgi:hypothetical protein
MGTFQIKSRARVSITAVKGAHLSRSRRFGRDRHRSQSGPIWCFPTCFPAKRWIRIHYPKLELEGVLAHDVSKQPDGKE